MDIEKVKTSISWWESFSEKLETETQHFHDYWNDLDSRSQIAAVVQEIVDEKLRSELVARIKLADEQFLKHTELIPTGITDNNNLHPDADWIYFRKPVNAGPDFGDY